VTRIIALIYLIVEGRKTNHWRLKPEKLQRPDQAIVKHSLSFAACVLIASLSLAVENVTTNILAIGAKQLLTKGAIVTRLARDSVLFIE
jgi:hypothetical protein